MKALRKAIWQLIKAQTGAPLAAIKARMWWGSAPAKTAYPYLVLRMPPVPKGERDNTKEIVQVLVCRFSCFTTDQDAADELVTAIGGLFDRKDMTLDAGRLLNAELGGHETTEDPDRENDGNPVWQGLVDVEFTVQRTAGQ